MKNNYDKVINYIPDELNEKGIVADEIVENTVDDVEEVAESETDNSDQSD